MKGDFELIPAVGSLAGDVVPLLTKTNDPKGAEDTLKRHVEDSELPASSLRTRHIGSNLPPLGEERRAARTWLKLTLVMVSQKVMNHPLIREYIDANPDTRPTASTPQILHVVAQPGILYPTPLSPGTLSGSGGRGGSGKSGVLVPLEVTTKIPLPLSPPPSPQPRHKVLPRRR